MTIKRFNNTTKLERPNTFFQSSIVSSLTAFCAILPFSLNAQVDESIRTQQSAIEYHSVTPVNFYGQNSINNKPNIMIVLDTSGSMGSATEQPVDDMGDDMDIGNLNDTCAYDVFLGNNDKGTITFHDRSTEEGPESDSPYGDKGNGNHNHQRPSCGAHPKSRSSVARRGIRAALEEQNGEINLGIMSYLGAASYFHLNGSGNEKGNDEAAILRMPLLPLNDNPDEKYSFVSGTDDHGNLVRNDYTALDYALRLFDNESVQQRPKHWIGLDHNGAIDTIGSTPIAGSIASAYYYLNGQASYNAGGISYQQFISNITEFPRNTFVETAATKDEPAVTYNDDATGHERIDGYGNGQFVDYSHADPDPLFSPINSDHSNPALNIQSCPINKVIILVTDGLSTRNTDLKFPDDTTCDDNNEQTCAEDAARASYNNGTSVYTIGFGSDPDLKDGLERLADAGQKGLSVGQSEDDPERDVAFASSAEEVRAAIAGIIAQIPGGSGAASNASIVSSEGGGVGATVQGRFKPSITSFDGEEDSVYWTGDVVSYFIDGQAIFRSDDDQDGLLDDAETDRPFIFHFDDTTDPNNPATKIQFLTRNGTDPAAVINGIRIPAGHSRSGGLVDIDQANPIWSGADWLNTLTNNTATLNTHRAYGSSGNARHILTWLGDSTGGKPAMVAFTTGGMGTLANGYLGVNSTAEVSDIIDFTRGFNDTGNSLRDRQLDNGTVYRLGDIIGSSPIQIDTALEDYTDASYQTFTEEVSDRRRVIYVGANDGMIHAFNGGFYSNDTNPDDPDVGQQGFLKGNGTDTEHDLGAELWAYVPRNVLPHLELSTRDEYTSASHIPMINGDIQAFDVKLWNETGDDAHPGGWGTIIVASMGLGGRERSVNLTDDTIFTPTSSYIVMDVTNPEIAPILLGELNSQTAQNSVFNVEDTAMRYATAAPAVMRDGENWYLVAGSGPTDRENFVSDKQANIFRFDLKALTDSNTTTVALGNDDTFQVNDDDTLIGDLIAHRWERPEDEDSEGTDDENNNHDAVYFGTSKTTVDGTSGLPLEGVAEGETGNPGGGLYRLVGDEIKQMINTNQPILEKLGFSTTYDNSTAIHMVLSGTGREVTLNDFETNDQNILFGVSEDIESYDTVSLDNLINVTDATVTVETVEDTDTRIGVVEGPSIPTLPSTSDITDKTTVDDIVAAVRDQNYRGWYSSLRIDDPSERHTAVPLVVPDRQEIAFLSTYIPPSQADLDSDSSAALAAGQCNSTSLGTSYLTTVDTRTGLPFFEDIEDFNGVFGMNDNGVLESTATIGQGNAGDSILVETSEDRTENGGPDSVIKGPTDQGNIEEIVPNIPPYPGAPAVTPYRKSWTEINFKQSF